MIVGYHNQVTGEVLCVPCAYRMDWDCEDDDIAAVGDDSFQATKPCHRCGHKLYVANVLRTCPTCGHLGTVGGGAAKP